MAVDYDFPDAALRFGPLESTVASRVASALPGGFQVGLMGAGPFNRPDWRKTLAVSGNLTPEERRVLEIEADAVLEAEFGAPPHRGVGTSMVDPAQTPPMR